MAISYDDTLRDLRLEVLSTAAGADAYIRIYDGTRPANGGATTTLLAELRGNAGGMFGAASGGVMTAAAITSDASANASGTATWFRVLASDGSTIVMDGSISTVAAGTGDLQLDSTTITATQTVAIDTFVITEGNDY
jgi:hypothetical protein